tara:strand:- start:6444 stop:7271 length:828 start_codon:yes stop_codon:yes gene_type:complete
MKIALFISGRITCYEENLIPCLHTLSLKNDIDLFISVNGIRDEYHIEAETKLNKWLKHISYEEYHVPKNFISNINPHTYLQNINGIDVPYKPLSCFYNDQKAYKNIKIYENKNNFKYNLYCKFRPDLIFKNLNSFNFKEISIDKKIIYSCTQPVTCNFWGNATFPMLLSDAFAYGNEISMYRYVNTYNFILKMNKKLNGKYRISYEPSLYESTMNCLFYYAVNETNYLLEADFKNTIIINNSEEAIDLIKKFDIEIENFSCDYEINSNRRHRDKI